MISKSRIVFLITLLWGGFLINQATATDCNCNDFKGTGGFAPTTYMYGLSGTQLNAGLSFTPPCFPSGASYVFEWIVDGNTISSNTEYSIPASTSFSHDFVWAGTYEVCLKVTYRFWQNGTYVENCSVSICETFVVSGPAYDPCLANADFDWFYQTGTGTLILDDISTTNSNGVIISKTWTVDGMQYTGDNPTHIFTSPGTYNVCLEIFVINEYTGECCTDIVCKSVDAPIDWDNPCQMSAGFTYSCFTDDCIFRFNGFSNSNRNVKHWYWDFGDGTTSNEQKPYHAYVAPGIYDVCLTIVGYDINGSCCYDKVCRTIDFTGCQGIGYPAACDPAVSGGSGSGPGLSPQRGNENKGVNADPIQTPMEAIGEVSVFPNPTNGDARVSFSLAASQRVTLSLVNAIGELEKQYFSNEPFAQGPHSIRVDCGDLSPGTYFITFTTGSKVQTQAIVIQ